VAELFQLPYVINTLCSVIPLRTDSVVHDAAQQTRSAIGALYGRPCPSLRDAAQVAKADLSSDSFKWASQLNTADSVTKHFSTVQADGHLRRIAEEIVSSRSSTFFPDRLLTLPPKADIGLFVARKFPDKPPGVFVSPPPVAKVTTDALLDEDEWYCWHFHASPSVVAPPKLDELPNKRAWADDVDSDEEFSETEAEIEGSSLVLPPIPDFPALAATTAGKSPVNGETLLSIGRAVQFANLVAASDLNGTGGVVKGVDAPSGRLQVFSLARSTTIKCRSENLCVADWCDVCSRQVDSERCHFCSRFPVPRPQDPPPPFRFTDDEYAEFLETVSPEEAKHTICGLPKELQSDFLEWSARRSAKRSSNFSSGSTASSAAPPPSAVQAINEVNYRDVERPLFNPNIRPNGHTIQCRCKVCKNDEDSIVWTS